jgi:GNAT superfamily N-acetyltransferase
MPEVILRRATAADADAISAVILQALEESNARDYPATVIAAVKESFTPAKITGLLTIRQVMVAIDRGQIVATGGLDGDILRSIFVLPGRQGQGIGRQLVQQLEELARSHGIKQLWVPASVTGEGFYRRLGYAFHHDAWQGEERTIVMAKQL